VDLSGAFALSGSFDYVIPNEDACRVGVGSPMPAALTDATVAGHQFSFIVHAANLNFLFPAAGTYQLDPNNKSGVFIDNGAQQFVSANDSRGSVRLNADGSVSSTSRILSTPSEASSARAARSPGPAANNNARQLPA
jgi:hypothetical protein